MKRAGFSVMLLCACLVAAGCDWDRHDCSSDDDCPYPEECIDNHCLDNSCPAGCPAGEYCSYGYYYPCISRSHCGLGCVDCANQGTNQVCVNHDHYDQWRCGCYGDYDCGGSCCYLMSWSACI